MSGGNGWPSPVSQMLSSCNPVRSVSRSISTVTSGTRRSRVRAPVTKATMASAFNWSKVRCSSSRPWLVRRRSPRPGRRTLWRRLRGPVADGCGTSRCSDPPTAAATVAGAAVHGRPTPSSRGQDPAQVPHLPFERLHTGGRRRLDQGRLQLFQLAAAGVIQVAGDPGQGVGMPRRHRPRQPARRARRATGHTPRPDPPPPRRLWPSGDRHRPTPPPALHTPLVRRAGTACRAMRASNASSQPRSRCARFHQVGQVPPITHRRVRSGQLSGQCDDPGTRTYARVYKHQFEMSSRRSRNSAEQSAAMSARSITWRIVHPT